MKKPLMNAPTTTPTCNTVYALSSAAGKAALAVVRISGPHCAAVWQQFTHTALPTPRTAVVRWLHHPHSTQRLDQALCLYFKAPHSFTGEDLLEWHVHGSEAVVQALLNALALLPNVTPAAPGEFTRRAVHNNKLNLLQGEALGDILDATCETQLHAALHDYSGGALPQLQHIRDGLLDAAALCAAILDFNDQDLPPQLEHDLRHNIATLQQTIAQHITGASAREKLRRGYSVAVIGAPNAGKSSLLNALTGRDMAIVSPIAGTTRDVVEAHFSLNGLPFVLADTAGLRDTNTDSIEAEGMRRATQRALQADVVVWLYDATAPCPDLSLTLTAPVLKVANKIDLCAGFTPPPQVLAVSAQHGTGLDTLRQALCTAVAHTSSFSAGLMLNNRHLTHLRAAHDALALFLARPTPDPMPECGVVELQNALRALDLLLGYHDIEQVLDRVFAGFCIGK